MAFLIDSSLPRSSSDMVRKFGQTPIDVRDIGLGTAPDGHIAAHAKQHGFAIISGDFDFADIRIYPPEQYAGIIVIDRPEHATVAVTLLLIERVFAREDIIHHIAGRLVIVDENRIRIRPGLSVP